MILFPQGPAGRIDAVDALRGYAILMVFFAHCVVYLDIPPGVGELLAKGRWGVQMFFVVSGFCIMQTTVSNALSTKEFVLRRLFRIAPLYWLAVAVFAVAALMTGTGMAFGDVVKNALLVHALSPSAINVVVPGGWSVGVEVVFYVLFWCARDVFRSLPGTVLALAVAVVLKGPAEDALTRCVVDVPALYLFLWPVNQLPAFLAGVLVWHLLRRVTLSEKHRYFLGVALWGVGSLFLLALLARGTSLMDDLLAFSLSYLLILIGLCLAPVGMAVNRAIVALGRISYGVYLTHIGMLAVCYAMMGPGSIMVAVAFLSSVALAQGLHVSVESPAIRLGKRLSKREWGGVRPWVWPQRGR